MYTHQGAHGTRNANARNPPTSLKVETGEITRRRNELNGGAGIIVEQRDGQTATKVVIGK